MADRIEAKEMLAAIQVSSFPKIKKDKRDKLHKELFQRAFPPSENQEAVTIKELGLKLAGLNNGG